MAEEDYSVEELKEFFRQSNVIEDVYSMRAVIESMAAWDYLVKRDEMGLRDLLHVHKLIMRSLAPSIAGRMRNVDVYVGGRAGYPPASLDQAIAVWLERANVAMTEESIRQSHIHFEFIHPFADGNGRTGRLVWLWQRFKNKHPYDIIKSETKYTDYYPWFSEKEAVERYSFSYGE
jgi:Fic family protein